MMVEKINSLVFLTRYEVLPFSVTVDFALFLQCGESTFEKVAKAVVLCEGPRLAMSALHCSTMCLRTPEHNKISIPT